MSEQENTFSQSESTGIDGVVASVDGLIDRSKIQDDAADRIETLLCSKLRHLYESIKSTGFGDEIDHNVEAITLSNNITGIADTLSALGDSHAKLALQKIKYEAFKAGIMDWNPQPK